MEAYEKDHLKRLRPLLSECTVLLKKDGSFPLQEAGELALYGSGARHTIKGGTGSGEVNSRTFITVEEGLLRSGFRVTTGDWLKAYDEILVQAKKDFITQIKRRAKEHHTLAIMEGMGAVMPEPSYDLPLDGAGDTAVYVLGRISGEGNDRNYTEGDILLSPTEIRDILALNEKYDRFMLVLNVGGMVDLSPVKDVKNILVLSQLGVETGFALADILLGKAYPSGKLTTSWARAEDRPPMGEFGDKDETRYEEGIYVGYRYYDSTCTDVPFPFGYGLGYTDFEIGDPEASFEGTTLKVAATVRNVGFFAGKETVQLYVSKPEGKLDQPYQALAGFKKTAEIASGEEVRVEIEVPFEELASYDPETSAWILEKGLYILRVGASSRETDAFAAAELDRDVTVKQVKKAFGTTDFTDWKPEKKEEELQEDMIILPLSADAFVTEIVSYEEADDTDARIEAMTDEELCYMAIGEFAPGALGALSVIGEASKTVAGAAGESCGRFKDRDIPALVMADGPAGLRISPDFFRDEKGAHPMGATLPATIADFMPKAAVKALALTIPKPKKGTQILHQYCTAIPIGTAIAQSWNPEVAEICGDVVGDEMERFNVQLWLAPALNIHRSIRCGRNFEYYSEDPLISGLFAAGITRGVQKHPGCGVTVKHFCANNQEYNRYGNNSQVSERALREIYLKGFEICVREAQPHALMTSYNLLNGTHTSERRDLTTDVLRQEFGYQGIVMTDWVVSGVLAKGSGYRAEKAAETAAAGGDLFMPGTQGDYEDVLSALKNGTLSRKQLERNAVRVLRMAERLTNRS